MKSRLLTRERKREKRKEKKEVLFSLLNIVHMFSGCASCINYKTNLKVHSMEWHGKV